MASCSPPKDQCYDPINHCKYKPNHEDSRYPPGQKAQKRTDERSGNRQDEDSADDTGNRPPRDKAEDYSKSGSHQNQYPKFLRYKTKKHSHCCLPPSEIKKPDMTSGRCGSMIFWMGFCFQAPSIAWIALAINVRVEILPEHCALSSFLLLSSSAPISG